VNKDNPISLALKDEPSMFAAGVDVYEVVRQVVLEIGSEGSYVR